MQKCIFGQITKSILRLITVKLNTPNAIYKGIKGTFTDRSIFPNLINVIAF